MLITTRSAQATQAYGGHDPGSVALVWLPPPNGPERIYQNENAAPCLNRQQYGKRSHWHHAKTRAFSNSLHLTLLQVTLLDRCIMVFLLAYVLVMQPITPLEMTSSLRSNPNT